MWSFTTRLTILMTEKLHHQYPHNAPTLRAKEIYPLRWEVLPASRPPDIADLPSLDYSLYLFNTVKFHLGQLRFFSEEQFVERLQEFYHGNPVAVATEYRLWFIQLLLVLSFGTALLCRSKSPDQPPGSRFFARAMSLMPDHASLWKDSLLAIEVLALASLYLYSIDQRESAHIYVSVPVAQTFLRCARVGFVLSRMLQLGQAIRIAQYEGMHTQLSEEQLGSKTVARCRSLWWTLYIMDRHFSYSVGLPMTTQDRDISTPIDPPEHCSQQDLALSLHAKLSRLLSYILSSEFVPLPPDERCPNRVRSGIQCGKNTVARLSGHHEIDPPDPGGTRPGNGGDHPDPTAQLAGHDAPRHAAHHPIISPGSPAPSLPTPDPLGPTPWKRISLTHTNHQPSA